MDSKIAEEAKKHEATRNSGAFIEGILAGGKRKKGTKGDIDLDAFMLSVGDETVPAIERQRRVNLVADALVKQGFDKEKIEFFSARDGHEANSPVRTFVRVKGLKKDKKEVALSSVLSGLVAEGLTSKEVAEETAKSAANASKGFFERLTSEGPFKTFGHYWKKAPMMIVGGLYAVGDLLATLGGTAEATNKTRPFYGDLAFGYLCIAGTGAMFLVDAKQPVSAAQELDAEYCDQTRKGSSALDSMKHGLPPEEKAANAGEAVFNFAQSKAHLAATGINAGAALYGLTQGAFDRFAAGNPGAGIVKSAQAAFAGLTFLTSASMPPKGVLYEETGLGKFMNSNPLTRIFSGPLKGAYSWLQDHQNAPIAGVMVHNVLGATSSATGMVESEMGLKKLREKYDAKSVEVPVVGDDGKIAYKPWHHLYYEASGNSADYSKDKIDRLAKGGWYNPANWLSGKLMKSEGDLAYQQIQGVEILRQGYFIKLEGDNIPNERRIRSLSKEELALVTKNLLQIEVGNSSGRININKDGRPDLDTAGFDPVARTLGRAGDYIAKGADKIAASGLDVARRLGITKGREITGIEFTRNNDCLTFTVHFTEGKDKKEDKETFSLYELEKEKKLSNDQADALRADVDEFSSKRRTRQDGWFSVAQNFVYLFANFAFSKVKPHQSIADPYEAASIVANRVLDNVHVGQNASDTNMADVIQQSIVRVDHQAAFFANNRRMKAAAQKGMIPGVDPNHPTEGLKQAIEAIIWKTIEDQAVLRGDVDKLVVIQTARDIQAGKPALDQEALMAKIGAAVARGQGNGNSARGSGIIPAVSEAVRNGHSGGSPRFFDDNLAEVPVHLRQMNTNAPNSAAGEPIAIFNQENQQVGTQVNAKIPV